jgi:hypothetical protein
MKLSLFFLVVSFANIQFVSTSDTKAAWNALRQAMFKKDESLLVAALEDAEKVGGVPSGMINDATNMLRTLQNDVKISFIFRSFL